LPAGPVPGRSLLDLHAGETPDAVARDYATAQTPFLAALNGTPKVRLRGVEGEFEAAVSVFELVYGGKLARMAICAELGGRTAADAFEEERRALQQRVEHRANHGPVAAPPNRQSFEVCVLQPPAAALAGKLKGLLR